MGCGDGGGSADFVAALVAIFGMSAVYHQYIYAIGRERMSEMRGIVFDNVCKNYGKSVAVDHLNMVVEAGERLILLGPSG